jgi:hypothetical protein
MNFDFSFVIIVKFNESYYKYFYFNLKVPDQRHINLQILSPVNIHAV